MIPPIIHRTWKDIKIPYDIYPREWKLSWYIHNKAEQMLHTDGGIRLLTEKYFPEYLDFFDKAPGIVKADFGRYLILYHWGGIYVDLDYECYKDISPLIAGHSLVLSWNSPRCNVINNAFLACNKGHLFFRLAAKMAADNWIKGIRGVEAATGPDMLTHLYNNYRSLLDNTTFITKEPYIVYPSFLLCPVDWDGPKHLAAANGNINKENLPDLRKKLIEDGAYAATYWCHNWDV